MTQLIINNIDDNITKGLQARAAEHGRTVEEEARAILGDAVRPAPAAALPSGLGTRITKRFQGIGLSEQEAAAFELHGEEIKPAEFD
ncbi:MAG: toxin-antitoxin system [Alphaproteobacteria bacterium]|nr:toxin-antitoxin system [Alphaproteobacteria bacterium]MBM3642082.1 toxin-antitoxin system [Alphaproteobacteria bacterium]